MYSILTQCPLFRGLTEEQIRKIIEGGDHTVTSYAKGAVIARQDTAYSGLMIVLGGEVHGKMTYASGKTVQIDTLRAPRLIAPAFLFGGCNKLPVDVIADTEASILTVHRGYLFELMQDNVLILSNFIDIVSNRANVWSKKIFFLSFSSLKEKVATYLLNHTSESSRVLPMPDITEIADYFDATRSAVETVLRELDRKHLIGFDAGGGRVEVLNRRGLEDVLK